MMHTDASTEDIALEVNGFGPDSRRSPRTVRYDDTVVDIEERPYFSSDGNISRGGEADSEDETDLTEGLPSRQIATLTYKSLGPPVRRRKASVGKSKAKGKTRRPTHICNEWRSNPEQINDQILSAWKDEDDEDIDADVSGEVRTAKRIEELRDMTINLSRKIQLRDALRTATIQRRQGTLKGQGLSNWTQFKYSAAIRWQHTKSAVSNASSSLGLWESHLKAFASHFGTDVTAYFLFLRWLFVTNVILGLLILVFLFVPNTLAIFAAKLTEGRTVTIGVSANNSYEARPLEGGELINGKGFNSSGFFEGTGMYYGDYNYSLLTSDTPTSLTYDYNMKLAYLLTYGCYFVLFFFVIAISVAKSYRSNFIESSDKFTFVYVLKVLDGWDYMIDSAQTAETKKKNMFRDLREFCASKINREHAVNCCESLMLFTFRVGAIFLMLVLIFLCGVAVYFTITETTHDSVLRDWATPIAITAINILIPFLFSMISSVLKFNYPKHVVYLTLAMTMLLYGATLGVYFINTMFPHLQHGVNNTVGPVPCWETRLGEKAYAFVVIDFLFGVVITLVSEVLYRLVAQYCCQWREKKLRQEKKTSYPQFDIARNTMALIYNQFLLWLGLYFSPLLTVVVVIKLWIIFYIKRVTVMNACIPTTKPWRAAKMHTVFLGLLFIGFIACIALFAVTLTIVKPSDTCGPFVNQTSASSIVEDAATQYNHYVMDIVLSPGVVVGIIVVLCVIVHYVRVTSAGRKTLISLLKIQITLESKDKAYLRQMLDEVQKHKTSRQEGSCGCMAACNCSHDHPDGGDTVTPMRPAQKDLDDDDDVFDDDRRTFAKERSATSMSVHSAASLLGSRDDLRK